MSDPVKEPQDRAHEAGTFETFCYLLLLLIPVATFGSCMWGGGDAETTKPSLVPVAVAKVNSEVSRVQHREAVLPATPTNEPRGANMLEQAILDAFPASKPKSKRAIKNARNAADFLGVTINQAGHLCGRPIEALPAAPGQYGVSCLKYREGFMRANYIVDIRTGSVDEI